MTEIDNISLEGLDPAPGTVDPDTGISLLGLDPAITPGQTVGRIFGRFYYGVRQAPALASKGLRVGIQGLFPEMEQGAVDDMAQRAIRGFGGVMIDQAQAEIKSLQRIEAATDLPLRYQGQSSGFLEDVAGGLATTVISLPAYAVHPALGFAVTFGQIQGMKIAELERLGVTDPETLLKSSIFSAGIQTPLEAISNLFILSRILKAKGTWTKTLIGIVQASGGEALTEFVQQYPDEWATIMALNPDVGVVGWGKIFLDNIGQTTEEAVYAATVGAVVGGGTTTVGSVAVQTLDSLVSAEQKAIDRTKSRQDRKDVLAAGARARKVIGASILQERQDQADEVVRITPEVIQQYIENPEQSPITDKDLDAIIGEEDIDTVISDLLNRIGIEEVPASIAASEVGVKKEPWEMTKEEYGTPRFDKGMIVEYQTPDGLIKKVKAITDRGERWLSPDGEFAALTPESAVEYTHKKRIQQALSEGKPVPPEVLKDYPDLLKLSPPPLGGGVDISQLGQTTVQDLPLFNPAQVEAVPLREALQSGLISEDEGAVIDGILQVFPEAWREHFMAAFSGQEFAPTSLQLQRHGVSPEEQQGQVVEGALLFKSVDGLKDDARRVAVMFGSNNTIETFLHEFGEFANAHLLTSEDKTLVGREYKAAKTKASENEWFADNFRDWWLRQIDGKSQVVSEDLQVLFRKVLQAVKEVWTRIRGLHSSPLDALFDDIITKGRDFNRQDLKAVQPKTPTKKEQVKKVVRRITGQARPETVKGAVRRTTGQVLTAEERLERDNLIAAIKMAARSAKIAMSEGNKEGLEKGKAEIRALFARAKERQGQRTEAAKIRARIQKLLKSTVPKKEGGKPKGKYGAKVQETLNNLRRASKLKVKEAAAKLEENLIAYQDEIPPYEIALENGVLSMVVVNLTSMPDQAIEVWGKLHEELKTYIESATVKRGREAANRAAQIEFYRESIIDIVGGIPEAIDTIGEPAVTDKSLRTRMRNAIFAGATNRLQGWKDILDILSFGDKTSRPGESIISQFGNVLDEKNIEKKGGMEAMDQIREMVLKVFGLKNDRQMIKKLQQDAEEHSLGTFENAKGQQVDLIMTRAQARKRIMEVMDPTLIDIIYNREGMAWTEEMVAAVRDWLTDADFEFIIQQLDWYQEYYQGINEVYSEIYGISLPHNPNYSPISRQGVNKVEEAGLGEFLKEMPFRASATSAGGLKSRVSSTLPIAPRNDIEVLQSHVSEMEHFKAWAQKIRELNAVFSNPDVRAAIRVNFGKNADQHIQNFIQDFARGGAETAANIRGWDRIRSRYTRAVLAVKPTILLKQLTSAIAYADSIPALYFAKEFVRLDQIKEAVKVLSDSTLVQHRWRKGEIERDIKTAMNSAEFARLRTSPSFWNKLMFQIKLGDMGAIILGGYPIYKYHRSKGKTHKEALRIFESVTESTQQSADLSEQSSWQRGGSFAKLFTMFKTSPNQYFRKEFGAIRNMAAGRIDKKQFFKTMAIYHLLLPMFFQWVSDRFTWDKEEQLRAMILGSLNGIFIFGDGLEAVIRAALGMQTFDLGAPIWSIFKDFGKALRLLDPDDLDTEDVFRAIRGLAGGVGGATGLPLKQTVDLAVGFSDLLAGEYEEGIAEVLGWSPYLAEKAAEEE